MINFLLWKFNHIVTIGGYIENIEMSSKNYFFYVTTNCFYVVKFQSAN
jgi:hypothetical protein